MQIRRLRTRTERSRAHELVYKGEPDEPAMHYPYTERAHERGHVMWGVFDDGELVAVTTAFIAKDPDSNRPTDLHLTMVYVKPSHRGYGLQRRLINTRLAYGRKQGCTIAYTYTNQHNQPSMINLLRCRFVPFQIRAPYVNFARRLP